MTPVRRRDLALVVGAVLVIGILVFITIGRTPWGLVDDAWRTIFGTNQGVR